MSAGKTVEITLKLPRAVVEFLNATNENVENYLAYSIMAAIHADVERGDIFPRVRKADSSKLTPVFKEYGLTT